MDEGIIEKLAPIEGVVRIEHIVMDSYNKKEKQQHIIGYDGKDRIYIPKAALSCQEMIGQRLDNTRFELTIEPQKVRNITDVDMGMGFRGIYPPNSIKDDRAYISLTGLGIDARTTQYHCLGQRWERKARFMGISQNIDKSNFGMTVDQWTYERLSELQGNEQIVYRILKLNEK